MHKNELYAHFWWRAHVFLLSNVSSFHLIEPPSLCSVIAFQGFKENGLSGFSNAELNLWPESLAAASSWFGVVVFGYGVSPFVFNFK